MQNEGVPSSAWRLLQTQHNCDSASFRKVRDVGVPANNWIAPFVRASKTAAMFGTASSFSNAHFSTKFEPLASSIGVGVDWIPAT
jgi:hypothetical protein